MKFIGAVFILCSTGYMGFRLSAGLRTRCASLQQLQRCLQIIRNEIAFCGTPIPEIFKLLVKETTGDLQLLFLHLSQNMQQSKSMRPSEALEVVLPSMRCPWLFPSLRRLTDKLGEYDLEAQLSGIDHLKCSLDEQLQELDQERRQKGKLYESLGICTGLALAILLI